jgi:hypothetical protein
MTNIKTRIVRVHDEKSSNLSKGQKIFNRLAKQIAQKKQELLDWQNTIPVYQNSHIQEFVPMTEAFSQLQENLVYLLDEAYRKVKLNQMEKKKLKIIICELAEKLAYESDSEELKLIYNKYSGSNLDKEISEDQEMIKSMFEGMLGVEIGDDVDFSSPDEAMRSIGEKISEMKKQQEAHSEKVSQKSRKKSQRTLQKEAKEQAEANHISQSIREVYRKLASALHPDRSQDESDQVRKDELMKRVNVAYAKKDLLQLLELQLEIEQIDQDAINCISEDRLKHYNKILKDQFEEIQREVFETACFFRMRFEIESRPMISLSPKAVMEYLKQNIYSIKLDIKHLEKDISLLSEKNNIKIWLKNKKAKNAMLNDFLFALEDSQAFGKKSSIFSF